jgi:metal transporter CNNM
MVFNLLVGICFHSTWRIGYVVATCFTFVVLIVIIGEVLPQALFARNPLMWMSRLAWTLWTMRVLTYVVSKPIALLLDVLFPKKGAALQSRQELGLLISEHLTNETSELDEDEVEIVRGALQLSEKRVRDIMTPLGKTFWLTPTDVLSGTQIDAIKQQGYSRIPIFDAEATNCFGILLMKQLVDLDFDTNAYTVSDMILHPVQPVGSMTALDTMFRKFILSGTHLIPVERDDKIVGVVTIEDLLEEIVGHEIEDESDRLRQQTAKVGVKTT